MEPGASEAGMSDAIVPAPEDFTFVIERHCSINHH
jgi:hypothetical protein